MNENVVVKFFPLFRIVQGKEKSRFWEYYIFTLSHDISSILTNDLLEYTVLSLLTKRILS